MIPKPTVLRAAALSFALLASGCGLWRTPPPLEVSPELAKLPVLEKIRAGTAKEEDLQAAFPRVERVAMNLHFEAQRTVFWFFHPPKLKTLLDMSLVSDGSLTNVRLQGRQTGSQFALYDLAVEGAQMRVGIPSTNMFFEGPIPPNGTEFHKLFGIEPWDFAPLATVASRIAWSDPKFLPMRDGLTLRPAKRDPLGLISVEFDLATGLPRSSHWQRGSSSWSVDYLAWDLHRNAARGGADTKAAWIVPTRMNVRTKRPTATMTLTLRREGDAYTLTINPQRLSEKSFKLEAKPGATTFSLDLLSELFRVDNVDVLKEILGGR